MRPFILLAGLLACASAPALASDPATYEDAVAAFQRGNYGLAAVQFEELITQSPSWAAGHVALGQCYYLLGEPERAESSIRTAREYDPGIDLFAAYFGAGQLLYSKKSFEQAVAPLEKALAHAAPQKRASTSLRLAHAYLVTDRYDSARRTLENHHRDYGVDATSARYLARACRKLGDYRCALNNVRIARESSKDDDRLIEYLGRWSYEWAVHPDNDGRREEAVLQAVEDTRSWYAARPDDPVALRYHTEALLAADRGADVVELLSPTARQEAQDCTARLTLAEAFNSLGDGRQAEKWALEAAQCDPSMSQAYIEAGAACIHQLRPEYSSLEEVRNDQSLTRKALESFHRARDLDEGKARRLPKLIADAQATLQRLDVVEADFVAHDQAYDDDVAAARDDEIKGRCKNLSWIVAHDAGGISSEDEAFYRRHDCKQYARQPGTGSD